MGVRVDFPEPPDAWADPYPDAELAPEAPASWTPLDLTSILDGTYTPPSPTLLARTDGVCLLYPGLTHSFHGESESGKSLVAQWLTATLLARGDRVLYLDYESDAGSVVDRLLVLGTGAGLTRDHVRAGFVYAQPELGPHANVRETRAWVELTRQAFTLVVLDGVTAALVASGMESKDNDQVTKWSREVPEALAHLTGAAVVMIDHVPKDASTRGRFAIGAQAKLGRITGAAFNLEPKRALGIGLRGIVALRVVKDRPGQLRRHTGPTRWEDRSAEVARFVLDSTQDKPAVELLAPEARDESQPFRPTAVMEKVSRFLETCTEPKSKNQVEQNVPGKVQVTRTAIELLVSGGWVRTEAGRRGALMHVSMKPYRQADDPASDTFTGQAELTATPVQSD